VLGGRDGPFVADGAVVGANDSAVLGAGDSTIPLSVKRMISSLPKFPSEACISTSSYQIWYHPGPYWQQIPSPKVSKILNV
jgi:hypothetical protein